MKCRGAVLNAIGQPWSVEDLELDEPRHNEVLVRLVASGVCHSDAHLMTGDLPNVLPTVGGHEGAGVVEAVGPGVTRVKAGDHIVTAFIPACGVCRWCAQGMQYICDNGRDVNSGLMLDGTARFHLSDGRGVGAMQRLGTFANWLVIHEEQAIRVDDDIPLEVGCLVACGVATGWGSVVTAGGVRPGDTVLVLGVGGVGMNAVQGAANAGASNIIAIDIVPYKLEVAREFGATHGFASIDEASSTLASLTNGQGADVAVVTVGRVTSDIIGQAFRAIRKAGTCVVTSVGEQQDGIAINPFELTSYTKVLRGALYGNGSPTREIPRLLQYYKDGRLRLDQLITRRYSLEQINDAFNDLASGRNIRGVVTHEH